MLDPGVNGIKLGNFVNLNIVLKLHKNNTKNPHFLRVFIDQ